MIELTGTDNRTMWINEQLVEMVRSESLTGVVPGGTNTAIYVSACNSAYYVRETVEEVITAIHEAAKAVE